ncbi:hypothetical protein Pint_34905 [Pistacia integerrima]|uniref:Uncharacterized protein n=1 Tax=Pistacia integerrima TaxID=434235 RepID=A0ACC0Y2C2_9ROSI|nr:hypothetical protein Pint_34905 [Pistacia integerrima]
MILVSGLRQRDQQFVVTPNEGNLVFSSTSLVHLVQWSQSTDCSTWSGVDYDAAGPCLNLAFNQFNAALIPSRLGNLTYYVSFLAVCYMVAFRIYSKVLANFVWAKTWRA